MLPVRFVILLFGMTNLSQSGGLLFILQLLLISFLPFKEVCVITILKYCWSFLIKLCKSPEVFPAWTGNRLLTSKGNTSFHGNRRHSPLKVPSSHITSIYLASNLPFPPDWYPFLPISPWYTTPDHPSCDKQVLLWNSGSEASESDRLRFELFAMAVTLDTLLTRIYLSFNFLSYERRIIISTPS